MSRLSHRLGSLALALSLAGTARAADPGTPPTTTDLQLQINELKRTVEQLKTDQLAAQQLLLQMRTLLERIDRMQQSVDTLAAKANTPARTSTSLYPGQPAGTGRVRIVNDFFTEVSAIVQGVSYRVPPGVTQDIPVNPGVVNLQILNVHSTMQARSVAANEVISFRVHLP